MKPSRFLSIASRGFLIGAITILCLFAGVVWLRAQGQKNSYEQGPGHIKVKAVHVPFVPGPKDKDGKVHQAKQTKVVIPPRHMTQEGIEEKKLADEGKIAPSTKQRTTQLTAAEIKSFGLNTPVKPMRVPPVNLPSGGAANSTARAAKTAKNSPSSNFAGAGYTGLIPPDGGVAAGPLNVVAVVNSTINVYDKNGNLLSSQALSNFFSGLPGASDGPFDPSVAYDEDIGRFWVVTTSAHDSTGTGDSNRSTLLVAVSNGSDVTSGGWSTFWMPADTNGNGSDGQHNGCDYPHFGIDAQAIYLSCNMFSFPFFSNSSSFQYARVRILLKSEFTGGGCCSWWDFWNLKEGIFGLATSFTVRPAIMHFAGTGDGDYWVNAGSGGFGPFLRVRRLTNAENCCNGSATGPTLEENDDGVGSFPSPPGANQPGTSTTIDSGDNRVLFATWQGGHLSLGQTISCSQSGTTDACAGFTEIDVSSYPTMSNVNDWFYSQPAGEDVYYPFVEQNANGDKTMVYTRSDASSTFAGAYYTTIPRSSSCTSCTGGETTMQAGQATYINVDSTGRNRWGDYHGAGADPDFLGIWVEGEYASTGNTWGTDIESSYNSYAPIAAFASDPVAFGNQTVFTQSASVNEFFENNGNATVYTTFAFLTGDPDFVITFDGCSFQTIQPGNFCAETLQFNPQSVGPGNATLNIDYHYLPNSFGTSLTASVTGTGVQASTSTAVALLTNPSVFGQATTFQAAVTSPTPGTPSGTVTFRDCPNPHPFCLIQPIGSGTLSGGVATLSVSFLAVGSHLIDAVYGGDANFTGSASGFQTQTVNKDASITNVTSSKNPSAVGAPVTFTTQVAAAPPGSGTPSGSVTFKDGSSTLGTSALSGGKATFTTSALAVGSHSITVAYGGDGNFIGSISPTLTQKVEARPTVSSLAPKAGPTTGGTAVTINGTNFVPGAGAKFGGTASAAVTFVSATQLKAVAPAHAAGTVDVTVTTPGGTSALVAGDHYAYGAPTVTSFTPTSGITGSTVTINGTGFLPGATVKFGGKASPTVTFLSSTQIKAIVPNGAVTGKISVTTPEGTATSATNFTVTLSITGFAPATGPTGTVVTINGVGFNASSTVKFNGHAATTVVHVSATQLKATVPSTATTGPITVTNTTAPTGTVSSAVKFTKT